MAALNELLDRIQDPDLRAAIQAEVGKLAGQKKFGLVFEDHIPECTPLYDVPVRAGSLAALKNGNIEELYLVTAIDGGTAHCIRESDEAAVEMDVRELVSAARFGEPIYPYLKPLAAVQNAPESDLWHTLIEADNYHALQLLEYLYAGKVDCIYIDPPYNTGAKDWKYNNDYVDGNDAFRHSKWLSMMEKRLKLAKKLLNPADSVLIVTIDEKEYLHLGCLLEELFPHARMQMVSSAISPQGATRDKQFSRTDEYIFFIEFGMCGPQALALDKEWSAGATSHAGSTSIIWDSLKRRGVGASRKDRPALFYPIFVRDDGKHIEGIGESLPPDALRSDVHVPTGCRAIWPLRSNGDEGRWQISQDQLREKIKNGYVRLGKFDKVGGMSISYLKRNEQQKVESGVFKIVGHRADGSIITDEASEQQKRICGTQWRITSHNAGTYGSAMLLKIFGLKRFDFPKSLYAVHDTIRFFVADKPNALIVDFFAGSGTTLHAVNLLNAEDGGNRRCIMVTNNEVSAEEAKNLTAKGYRPGDEEWEQYGIARYVTWPRTVCSIEGHDVNGNPLKGTYLGSGAAMADGFQANAAFFKLGFLDKSSVRLGRQFREMIPALWMKAGCHGPCPAVDADALPLMLVLPENHMAILNDDGPFSAFREQVTRDDRIETVYIVTDSGEDFRAMSRSFPASGGYRVYQLYKDYLDNFRINDGRR